jgi:hypothetical protein
MDEAERAKTAPKGAAAAKAPVAAGPGHLRWDTSEQRSHRCTLATASVTFSEIILNFGAKRSSGHPGGEVAVELVQQIALNPLTAKHLSATLERVIADYDRISGGSKP